MKEQINELARAKSILSSVLGTALNSMSDNRNVSEARGHIKQAINKLESVQKTQIKRKKNNQTAFEQWQNVLAGVSSSPTTASAVSNNVSLDQLNSMIDEEKQKLDDLEKASGTTKDDEDDSKLFMD